MSTQDDPSVTLHDTVFVRVWAKRICGKGARHESGGSALSGVGPPGPLVTSRSAGDLPVANAEGGSFSRSRPEAGCGPGGPPHFYVAHPRGKAALAPVCRGNLTLVPPSLRRQPAFHGPVVPVDHGEDSLPHVAEEGIIGSGFVNVVGGAVGQRALAVAG